MENAISLKEFFMMMLGFGYLINHRSREVHKISEKHRNCHLELVAKQNREYVTRRKAKHLIKDWNYNGCRWCWNPMDNG